MKNEFVYCYYCRLCFGLGFVVREQEMKNNPFNNTPNYDAEAFVLTVLIVCVVIAFLCIG